VESFNLGWEASRTDILIRFEHALRDSVSQQVHLRDHGLTALVEIPSESGDKKDGSIMIPVLAAVGIVMFGVVVFTLYYLKRNFGPKQVAVAPFATVDSTTSITSTASGASAGSASSVQDGQPTIILSCSTEVMETLIENARDSGAPSRDLRIRTERTASWIGDIGVVPVHIASNNFAAVAEGRSQTSGGGEGDLQENDDSQVSPPPPSAPALIMTTTAPKYCFSMESETDVVFSYRTKSTTDPVGGEKLMWRLESKLRNVGITSFNGKQVLPGSNWRKVWCEKLARCKVVVPLLSPPFFESPACLDELTFASNFGKTIIPVLAEGFSDTPLDMRMILQSCNRIPPQGRFEDGFDENVGHLVEAIQMSMMKL